MAFHAYLFFGGNCRDAFTRYQEIFGGELFLLRMGDMPGDEPVPAGMEDVIMHAALKVGDQMLMASDDPTTENPGPVQGIMVSFTASDAGEAKKVFDQLAEGGEVRQAITETFFSPAFGMCVDRFGTPWMVNTASADQPG
jgi:PhnB protein